MGPALEALLIACCVTHLYALFFIQLLSKRSFMRGLYLYLQTTFIISNFSFISIVKANKLFLFVCLLHTVLAVAYIAQRDICVDEPDYIEYAKRWMHGQPDRVELLDDSKTPVVVIAWLPRIVEQFFHKQTQYNDWGKSDQRAGRYPMILYTLLAVFYLYLFSKKYLQKKWQLLPVILFLFDPLILGHSGMIGSDIACAFVYTAVLYHLINYLKSNNKKDFLLLSIFIGIGCITKQSLVLLIFFIPLIIIFYCVYYKLKIKLWSLAIFAKLFLVGLIICFVINAGFYFKGSFAPLKEYNFESKSFQNVQQKLTSISSVPIPLPRPFIMGFDMIKKSEEIGGGTILSTYQGVHILGKENTKSGFWYYYIVSAFFKMPILILFLAFSAIILFFKSTIAQKKKLSEEKFVVVIGLLIYAVFLSFFNSFQIGIRHVIFLLPSCYFLLCFVVQKHGNENTILYSGINFFACWQLISLLFYFNNYIAYTNEFVYNKTKAIVLLSDSNIDYGQSNSFLKKYATTHEGFNVADSIERKGKIAVRAIDVIHTDKTMPDLYKWLREKYKPYGNYKSTIWLYDIK